MQQRRAAVMSSCLILILGNANGRLVSPHLVKDFILRVVRRSQVSEDGGEDNYVVFIDFCFSKLKYMKNNYR